MVGAYNYVKIEGVGFGRAIDDVERKRGSVCGRGSTVQYERRLLKRKRRGKGRRRGRKRRRRRRLGEGRERRRERKSRERDKNRDRERKEERGVKERQREWGKQIDTEIQR